jgi:hypothetical protein
MSIISATSKINLLCYALMFIAISCQKHDTQPKSNFQLSGKADASQEVPPVIATATGRIYGNYYKPSKVLSFTIQWDTLSGNPTAMYFNGPAFAGATGHEIYGMTVFRTVPSGSYSGYLPLSAEEETDLMAGKWYFNIKTVLNPNGEIRGQISVQ